MHHGPCTEIDVPGTLSLEYYWIELNTTLPGYMGRTIANPTFDWTFLSVPQKRANDRVVLQPRGKGLGGSSLVSTFLVCVTPKWTYHRMKNNFLGIFRPSKDEIDAIEELGNPGWNWDSMLQYLKKVGQSFYLTLDLEFNLRFIPERDPPAS